VGRAPPPAEADSPENAVLKSVCRWLLGFRQHRSSWLDARGGARATHLGQPHTCEPTDTSGDNLSAWLTIPVTEINLTDLFVELVGLGWLAGPGC